MPVIDKFHFNGGCVFLDASKILCSEDINVTNLTGTWDECYDNPYFIMDGIVEYTFYDNGTHQVYSYDALSHMEHTRTNTYVLQDDLLILNTEHSENALRYHIVKLKKDEMAWQNSISSLYHLRHSALTINRLYYLPNFFRCTLINKKKSIYTQIISVVSLNYSSIP